jgi:predicted small lipoprotein YifL
MNIKQLLFRIMAVFGLTIVLAACGDDGPMEQAGESLDETVTDTQNAIEDSCESLKKELESEDKDC